MYLNYKYDIEALCIDKNFEHLDIKMYGFEVIACEAGKNRTF